MTIAHYLLGDMFPGMLAIGVLPAVFLGLKVRRSEKRKDAAISALQVRSKALETALLVASDNLHQAQRDTSNRVHNDAIERAARLCDERLGPKNTIAAAVRALRVKSARRQISTSDYPLLTDVIAPPK